MHDNVAPDRIGEVAGWRAWRVIGDERFPLLASATHSGTVWHPDRWTFATCAVNGLPDLVCTNQRCRGERIPGTHCSCGLYAAASRTQLVRLGYGRDAGIAIQQPRFIGEVAFAGKVVPGSAGWRAEKGRIVRLYVPHVHWRWVDPIESMYDVEVVLDNTQIRKEVI